MSESVAVITGWGVVSPIGCSQEAFTNALFAGHSGAAPIAAFDASGFECQVAAEVGSFDIAAALGGRDAAAVFDCEDRRSELGAAACAMALDDAGLTGEEGSSRWAVSVGTGLSSVVASEVEADTISFLTDDDRLDLPAFAKGGLGHRDLARRHDTSALARLIEQWTEATGPVGVHFSACAAGAQAIGQGLRWIRRGVADVVVCGGMDSMVHPFGVASFMLLGALTTHNEDPSAASRPFDRQRDGFLLGEGAAFLVLESRTHAENRGARSHGELIGYGSSIDAHNVTAPHPEGRGARLAISRCLADGGLAPEQVQYVNAHGTGTALNDPVEAAAIFAELGAVPVSSTKAAHGHLVAAAGAIEACVCLAALKQGRLPATLNLRDPEPGLGIDLVAGDPRALDLEICLSNSFGFGGQNAVLAFRRSP